MSRRDPDAMCDAVLRAQRGDFDALHALCRPVFASIARNLSRRWWEELVQSAMLKLWRRVDRIDVGRAGAVAFYVRTIATRAMRDELRRMRSDHETDSEKVDVPVLDEERLRHHGTMTRLAVRSVRTTGDARSALRAVARQCHTTVRDVENRVRAEMAEDATLDGLDLPPWIDDEDVIRSLRDEATATLGSMAKREQAGIVVERVPIDSIATDPTNVRKHNDRNLDAIADSLRRFGQQKPLVVAVDNRVVAGNGTLEAARRLGWTHIEIVRTALKGTEAEAYAIADNRTTDLSEFDDAMLAAALRSIGDVSDDLLKAIGFDANQLAGLIEMAKREGNTDPDDVPAPPDEATTKPGQIWKLGSHRLMCGDSGSVKDLDRLLAGARIHLVNTDPPYNVKVEPRSNNAIAAGLSSFSRREDLQCGESGSKRGKKDREARLNRAANAAIDAADAAGMHHQGFDLARHKGKSKPTSKKLRAKDRPLANDFVTDEAFDGMLDAWFGNIARVLLPGHAFYIWGGYANCANYPPFLKKHQLYFSQAIIWVKQHPVLTRKDFMGNHEWCFYGWLEGAAHRYFGPHNATDVWEVKKVNPQSMVHLTEKPVELATLAMSYSSQEGENVLDLFGGSGSTLIGAEQCGRNAYLMELDPLYCDVIVQRFEKFTGRKAELAT